VTPIRSKDVPKSGIQIEALLDFIVDIVLQDSIYVDAKFMNTWEDVASVFNPLTRPGLLYPIPFLEYESQLAEPRKLLVDTLCVTTTLKIAQSENEALWGQSRHTANSFMSSIIWGTAGFLSRSHVFEAPYHGHPARKRLLDQTLFSNSVPDAADSLAEWIRIERLRIFHMKAGDGFSTRATLVLPPIAIEVIEEASSVTELIPVAYQKRDKYKKLREWLKEIQIGLESDSAKVAIKFKKTLAAISRDLDTTLGVTDSMPISLELGFDSPSLGIELPVRSGIRKRFGISATLNKMLIAKRGAQALKHLMDMFDESGKAKELAITNYLKRVGSNKVRD
jgi:hypothetical protein